MKPLDPRLLRYASASRSFLVIGAVLGLVQTVAMIGFAWCIAVVVTRAIAGYRLPELLSVLAVALGCVAVRALAQWGTELAGARAAAAAKTQLRGQVMSAITQHPRILSGRSSAEITTLTTHGLDALDPYFGKFLPQLLLTMIATPLLIVVTWFHDPVSAITEVLTLPVIPVFMILIGLVTTRVQRRQLDSLTGLANAFLELVEGLSTLKIFGRANRQRERLQHITDDYRQDTLKVLRVSFLSGFALELFASLSVALVAVQIGIRLIDDEMPLLVGLFALILAPEVFAPLRQVGAQFHNASEGVAAAQQVFALLEAGAQDQIDTRAVAAAAGAGDASGLQLRNVHVAYGEHTVLHDFSASFKRGEITALSGESGAGKSTLFGYIMGQIDGEGERLLDGQPLAASDAASKIAWMGQRAGLLQGTVRENLALGETVASDDELREALRLADLDWLSLDLELGVGGSGLSGGQAQRLSLARTIARARARNCAVVLCDEPTSALDTEREQTVIRALRALAGEGRIVAVISHRRAVIDAADRVLTLQTLAVEERA